MKNSTALSLAAFLASSFSVLPSTVTAGTVVGTIDGKILFTKKASSKEKTLKDGRILRKIPAWLAEGAHGLPPTLASQEYTEVYRALPFTPQNTPANWPGSEVRTLVSQGPTDNRIDLTIVGDGYTATEKTRFFEDAERITNDLFGTETFESYLPLFNVHAVFVPSRESGITDTVSRDTALGLYRTPRNSKRGIMVGDQVAAERAIGLAPDTNFPILLANDDFYGGLGGRYAITTRSLTSGTMVLRHELGHNFGDVGEEYDGGSTYAGANSSRRSRAHWDEWLEEDAGVWEVKFLNGEYLWQNLSSGAARAEFTFPRGPYEFSALVSSVGFSSPEDVHVLVNGQRAELTGQFTNDRSFFEVKLNQSLAPGRHRVDVIENIHDGDNVLAFVQIYAVPIDTDRNTHAYGSFSTFNQFGNRAGYRPTFDTCLMRNMRSNTFCSVDQENMWLRFLRRVSLIDSVNVIGREVSILAPALPLKILWFKLANGREELVHEGSDRSFVAPSAGSYRIDVQFQTDEVRQVAKFTESKTFTVR